MPVNPVVDAFQPAVKPAQVQAQQVQQRLRPEVAAGEGAMRLVSVCPRPQHRLLVRRLLGGGHAQVTELDADPVSVEPAALVKNRDVDVAEVSEKV